MLDQIDWQKVADAINKIEMADFDREEVCDRVVEALKRYGQGDLKDLSIQGVEERFEFERGKGFIDLWGFRNGRLKIIDWKTTGSITDNWEFRESNSQQGIWYVHALKSIRGDKIDLSNGVEFEIRGVARSSGVFKSLKRVITQDEIIFHDINQARWMGLKDTLIQDLGWNPEYGWPRAFPAACRPFGPKYPCEFYDACESNRPVLYEIGDLVPRSLNSYSSEKEFQRCPERYRNLVMKKTLGLYGDEDDRATLWGSAFHAGVKSVWEQLKDATNNQN